MGSLSTTMCSIAPLTVAAGAVLALCMIGYAGRDLVKRMLSRRVWDMKFFCCQNFKTSSRPVAYDFFSLDFQSASCEALDARIEETSGDEGVVRWNGATA